MRKQLRKRQPSPEEGANLIFNYLPFELVYMIVRLLPQKDILSHLKDEHDGSLRRAAWMYCCAANEGGFHRQYQVDFLVAMAIYPQGDLGALKMRLRQDGHPTVVPEEVIRRLPREAETTIRAVFEIGMSLSDRYPVEERPPWLGRGTQWRRLLRLYSKFNFDELPPLHLAARSKHYCKFSRLAAVEDIDDIRDRCGRTALHVAAARGSLCLVRKLVKHGASLQSLDRNNRSVLHHAVLGALIEAYDTQRKLPISIPRSRAGLLRWGKFSKSDWETVDGTGRSPCDLISYFNDYKTVLPRELAQIQLWTNFPPAWSI